MNTRKAIVPITTNAYYSTEKADTSYAIWAVRTEDTHHRIVGAYVLASSREEAIQAAEAAIQKDFNVLYLDVKIARRIASLPKWAADEIRRKGYCTWED